MSALSKFVRAATQQLTFRYLFALGTIALGLGSILLQSYSVYQKHYVSRVNLTIRQGMLSQRIALIAQHLAGSTPGNERIRIRRELLNAIDLMRRSHEALMTGKVAGEQLASNPPTVAEIYFDAPAYLDEKVGTYLEQADKLARLSNEQFPISDSELSAFHPFAIATILNDLDAVTREFEIAGERSDRTHVISEGLKIVGILMVLVYISLVILQPMVRRIQFEVTELKKLSTAVEQSPVSVIITDTAGRIEYVNPKFTRLTGYSAEEVVGKNPHILNSGYQSEEFYKQLWDTITAGKVWRGEFCNKKKNGELYWESSSISSVTDPEGRITHYLAVKEDITERKRTEAALRKSEAKYRMITETASDVIITIDEEREILFVNRAAENIFGYAIEEMLGQSLTMLMPNLLDRKHKNAWKQYLSNGRKRIAWAAVEPSGLHKSGKQIFLEISFNEFEEDGRHYFTGILRDITQQKTAEAEILRAQKLESLGIMAGGLAHDFNNFLMTILMNISSARLTAKKNAKIQEVLKAAEHAIDRAKAITRQLSTFTRGGKTRKDTVYLTPLLKEAVQFALHGTRVMPEFQLVHDLNPVHVDSGQINQVINNLVINAMQAMPRGGRLIISTSNVTFKGKTPPGPLKTEKYVEVDIQDTGVGILPEIIGKIFDPYFTSKKEGTGLGLFSCFSILDQHQGWITVASELGQGSTFTFYLPAAS